MDSPAATTPPDHAAERDHTTDRPSAPHSDRRADRRSRLILALMIAGVGLLLFHGRLVSSDEIVMARAAFAIGREGSLTFPEVYGRTSSEYGLLASVQGLPWVWIEAAVQQLGLLKSDASITLLPLANLLNVILLAFYFRALARRMGASDAAATASSLLLILATPYLPYAGSFFSEPATALALTATAYHLGIGLSGRKDSAPHSGTPSLSLSLSVSLSVSNSESGSNSNSTSDGDSDSERRLGGGGAATSASLDPLLAGMWLAVALHLRVITGALWPIWGAWVLWRCRDEDRSPADTIRVFARLAVFPAVGVVGLLILNTVLRGGPFLTGYETSAFTVPLATGLHGLLLSPDRGILLQCPLTILAVWAWAAHGRDLGRTGLFCLAALGMWLLLHATFWAWHGGWTPGPRYFLPVACLFFLPLPLLLSRWTTWGGARRLVVVAIVGWGAAQAVAQTLVNPLDWNNELWGFLSETESRFLFEPQVSSWRGIWTLIADGSLRPLAWGIWPAGGAWFGGTDGAAGLAAGAAGAGAAGAGAGAAGLTWFTRAAEAAAASGASRALIAMIAVAGAACGVAGLGLIGFGRIRRAIADTLVVWTHWGRGSGRPVVATALAVAITLALASALSGPRGLTREVRLAAAANGAGAADSTSSFILHPSSLSSDKRLRWGWPGRPAGSSATGSERSVGSVRSVGSSSNAPPALRGVTWEGYLDLPLAGRYIFYLKARGVYSMSVDGQPLFSNDDPAKPQHIPRAAVELKPGTYPVQIVFAPDADGGGVFRLFWQWPGEGRLIEPLDVQYLLPRTLSPLERLATRVWRHGLLLGTLAILSVALASRQRRETD